MNEIALSNKNITNLTQCVNELSTSLSKVSKFANLKINIDMSTFEGVVNSVKSVDDTLSGVVKGFNSLGSFNKNINELAQGGSLLATAYNTVNNALLNNVGGIELHTIATNISAAATTAFSTALEFLKANPLMAVIGALGLVVGALVLFGDSENEAEKETRLFIEAQEAKRSELVETSKAINESTAAAIENAKNAEVQSDVLKGFVSNLKGLTNENGFVKNFEQAQYYVDQINSSMPGTVKLTEDGQLTWLKNAEAINENVKQLERKAKVEAYYDGYVESLKNETRLRGELTLAQNNYNAELKKKQGYQEKYNALMEKSKESRLTKEEADNLTYYRQQMEASEEKLSQYSETLDKAKGAYEANAKGAELYNNAVGALDGSVSSSVKLQLEEYKELDENGKITWESLAAASEDCKNRMVTAQKDELEAIQATSALVQVEMINKALSQGMTYDQMISELQEKGMQLNDTEKKQLMKSFDQWKMNSEDIKNAQAKGLDTLKLMKATTLSDMNENDQRILSESVKAFAKNGDASGIELCNKLAASLEANNGKVTDEAKGIMDEIKDAAYNTDPTVSIRALPPSKSSIEQIKSIINNISKDKKVTIDVALNASAKVMQIIGASAKTFASGGFPDTGELFVAREAGPELVGRINGKTAVANNDQIVSGISSGVFNAVTSAMKGINSKGNMNIHATFVMDGEVVGKQVIKYHNGVVNRTGRSPLMI